AVFRIGPGAEPGGDAVATPGCSDGCRLVELAFDQDPGGLRLSSLRQTAPDRIVIDEQRFQAPGRGRPVAGSPSTLSRPERVVAVDAPLPLPVVATGDPDRADARVSDGLSALGADAVPVEVAAVVDALPGLPTGGYLVDYEYLARLRTDRAVSGPAEVWLAAG